MKRMARAKEDSHPDCLSQRASRLWCEESATDTEGLAARGQGLA